MRVGLLLSTCAAVIAGAPVAPDTLPNEYLREDSRGLFRMQRHASHMCSYPNDRTDLCTDMADQEWSHEQVKENTGHGGWAWNLQPVNCAQCVRVEENEPNSYNSTAVFCYGSPVNGEMRLLRVYYRDFECHDYMQGSTTPWLAPGDWKPRSFVSEPKCKVKTYGVGWTQGMVLDGNASGCSAEMTPICADAHNSHEHVCHHEGSHDRALCGQDPYCDWVEAQEYLSATEEYYVLEAQETLV